MSESALFLAWLDSIRGRVGSMMRGRWAPIRDLVTTSKFRSWFNAGEKPQAIAVHLVKLWKRNTSHRDSRAGARRSADFADGPIGQEARRSTRRTRK